MSEDNPSTADPFGSIADEFVEAFRQGQRPSVEEFARRYPEQADAIREMLPALVLMEKAKAADDTAGSVESAPSHIGRYRVAKLLGQGGFGLVYLAHDDQLQRPVAIKVPHARLVAQPADAEAYLAEARTVAGLDHPHIVPVFDVGSDEQYPCFVVSKYIDGTDLAARLKQSRLAPHEAAELVATVAEALHHAHKRGLVHRDIKPGNILLNRTGKPFVGDFGLALREQDVGRGPCRAGTPAYTSPEQARGEGHRVDGRSDVFSLGVVFYELLVGRPPFRADSPGELLERVANHEPRPLRQLDDGIPKELERICFKALSKRASERYMTAQDMADDLRYFLAGQTSPYTGSVGKPPTTPLVPAPGTGAGSATAVTPPTPTSDHPPAKVVPKGLRSFDAHDADFFLELLPGPRDRDGLPESLRFWKARIEESDPGATFAVGVLYGPSGCGKSSLVKAGLLPWLADDVLAVYVEATAEETETRLLKGLRRHCPGLPAALGLAEAVAALRHGHGLPPGRKVLLVLDQFEQWLHARRADVPTELVPALRQCDGQHVQCLVLVRDDFWLAVSRFLGELEVELVQGRNMALVDLFDRRHARRVLAAFGRAFGALPEGTAALNKEQEAFLGQAVEGLSQDGKVVCVRLAVFAELVKGRPWTAATLRGLGGMQGVGVTFLEETFTAATAAAQHRVHRRAAQAVLKALLPESGSDIKGSMRSEAELLAASGYGGQPRDFGALLRILGGELRLITPTDPEGQDGAAPARGASEGTPLPLADASGAEGRARYYELTHDYLVPALREWLARKQKETWRGRAQLRLAELAGLWQARPESRHLPAWWEWLDIRLFTRQRDWTAPQRRMMGKASRFHLTWGTVLAGLLAVLVLAGWWSLGELRARAKVETLLTANTAQVPKLVGDLAPHRRWADPILRAQAAQEGLEDGKRLHLALALLPVDAGQADYLCTRLLSARGPDEVSAIRTVLHDYAPDTAAHFWPVLQEGGQPKARRLRAACALAPFAADDPRWAEVGDDLARSLPGESIALLGEWARLLQDVRGHLVPHLVRHLVQADAGSFPAFLAVLSVYPEDAVAELDGQLQRTLPATAKQDEKQALAGEQAQAAVALLRLGQPARVWPLFHQGPDPTCRTYLIHRCAALRVDAAILADHLLAGEESDPSARQGLLLALGEYSADQRAEVARGPLPDRALTAYRDDPDPGVHSGAEWLLRRWQMGDRLAPIDQQLVKASPGRQHGEVSRAGWYVNGQGQTFAVIPAPGPFEIGSPPDEKGRSEVEGEDRRRVQIDYPFAVGLKLVTVAEFKQFRPAFDYPKRWSPGLDTPINAVSWYDAAAYCNWLSAREGLAEDQWCYPPLAEIERAAKEADARKGESSLKLPANWQRRTGYRLPTEAEWEYACRAGTVTAWSYGSDQALVVHYAWCLFNATTEMHPVGSLKPNGLGLFDVHGNAWQWCQDAYGEHDKVHRVLRGGSFDNVATAVRSAYRSRHEPWDRYYNKGFRVARTYR